jgi:hypothetical protein
MSLGENLTGKKHVYAAVSPELIYEADYAKMTPVVFYGIHLLIKKQ